MKYEAHTLETVLGGQKLVGRGYNLDHPGTPIYYIHGLVASIDFVADSNLFHFCQYGPVISISLPGHAPSVVADGFKGPYDVDFFADSIHAQVEAFGNGKPGIIWGHSTGASAALATAIKYPDSLAGVIVCEGSPHGREETGIFARLQKLVINDNILGRIIFKSIFKINGFRPWTNRAFLGDLFADKKRMYEFDEMWETQAKYWPALQDLDLDVMVDMFKDLHSFDVTDSLHKIKCPVQVVLGEKDPFIPKRYANLILEKVSNCDFHMIKGGGHVPFFETPDEFYQVASNFIETKVLVNN